MVCKTFMTQHKVLTTMRVDVYAPLALVRQSLGGAADEHARNVRAVLRGELIQDLVHALPLICAVRHRVERGPPALAQRGNHAHLAVRGADTRQGCRHRCNHLLRFGQLQKQSQCRNSAYMTLCSKCCR